MNDPRQLHLTPLEQKFFKLYAAAARRDYHVLQTAAALMNPDELGILCPTHATRVADGMQELYLEFDEALNRLTGKHNFVRRTVLASPSDEEMINLVTISFFKLVAVLKGSADQPVNSKDGGWFSGETEDWQKNIAALKKSLNPAPEDNPMSPLLSAMLQLFNALVNKNLPFLINYQPPEPTAEEQEWDEEDEDDPAAPEDFD